MASGVFEKVNRRDGKQKTCKFCGCAVWWDVIESRWYDAGGHVLHVDTCDRSKQHYHNQAMDNAETRRQAK